MIKSGFIKSVLKLSSYLFVCGLFFMVTVGFLSLSYYHLIAQHFNVTTAYLTVGITALVISTVVFAVFYNKYLSTKQKPDKTSPIGNFVKSYPRVSILTVALLGYAVKENRDIKELSDGIVKSFSSEEIIRIVADNL